MTPIGTRARLGAWRRRGRQRDIVRLGDNLLATFTGGVLGALFATLWCLIFAPAIAVWIGAPQ